MLSVEERLQRVSYARILAILMSTSMLTEATRRAKLDKTATEAAPPKANPPKPKRGALAGYLGASSSNFVGMAGVGGAGRGTGKQDKGKGQARRERTLDEP